VSQCTVYFPGLLGPAAPIELLAKQEWPGKQQFPHLAKFFARGKVASLCRSDIETRLLNGIGILFDNEDSDVDVPIAKLRAMQVRSLETEKRLWCLDPVYIQIDKEDAVLQANEELGLTESEARQIIEDLNTHFAQDNIKLHYHSAHRWLLEAELELATTSLSTVLLNPISGYQPTGRDEKKWRNLINEVQMLLYAHPVNQQREEHGELPANSVWLWGGGETYHYEKFTDGLFCDEPWVKDIAGLYDITYRAASQLEEQVTSFSSGLIIFLDQLVGIKQNDVFAWLESLRRFENETLSILFALLSNNQLTTLTIISDTISITITRKQLNQWWRRVKPMYASVLTLRDQYGF